MNYLAFDIETIPNQLLPVECMPVFDPEEVKHGNTKDPVKRAAKEAEEKEKFDASISKTMSLDPAFCSICTFSAKRKIGDTEEIITRQLSAGDCHDDLENVTTAIKTISEAYRERIPLVSFNGLSFDLPIILFRAIAQDVKVDMDMWQSITRKYGNRHHYDVMQILSGWDRQKWHKQDFYAKLFGIGDPGAFDGSMVFPAYQAGEYDVIKKYCENDVNLLSGIFERIYPWILCPEIKEEKQAEGNNDQLSESFEKARCIK